MQFTREHGDEGVSLVLPVGQQQLLCTLAGYPQLGYVSGLSQIDEKNAPYNETGRTKSKLTNGTPYDVLATVDIDQRLQEVTVEVALNGKQLIHFDGPISRLSDSSWNSCDDPRKLGIAAEQSVVRFHNAHLELTDGTAALLWPAETADRRRPAAEQLLALGAKLTVQHDGKLLSVATLADLPPADYSVLAVDAAGTHFSDVHAWTLLEFPELVAVDLSDTWISDVAAAPLDALPRLTILNLSSNRLSAAVLPAIGRCRSLRELTLRKTPIPLLPIEQWSSKLPSLRVLL